MISDDALLKKFSNDKKIAQGGLSKQYKNNRTCQAFYAGDAMELTGKVAVRDDKGAAKYILCQFNKVKPYVNAARGFFLQTRNEAKFQARADKKLQEFYSDFSNGYHDYNRDNARASAIEARQDLDMLVNGYGVTDTYLTFGVGYASRNPDGEIGMCRLDPNKYWWDPSARETNLIDRAFDNYCKEYFIDEAKDLFDAEESDFEKKLAEDYGGEYMYNPQGGVKNLIREYYDFADFEEKIINVNFYQWREIETYYRAENPIYAQTDPEAVRNIYAFLQSVQTETEDDLLDPKAQILNCSEATKEALEEYLEIEFTAYKRNCYYSAVISGKKVFTKYKNISQDGFTRKVKTGDFDEKNKMWVGMVNAMIEPQKYFNKAITEFLYTIASLAKGGVMYEEDAIDDIREFEANYLKPDGNAEVANGALSGGKIQPKREGYVPTGVEKIIDIADTIFPDVTGLPDSFIGAMESRNETAALQRQRIKQASNTLASYVDSILLYQKEHARLMLDLMKELASFGGDREFPMADDEGNTEFVPVRLDHFVNEYYIDIVQAPDSEIEKVERIQSLVEMGTLLMGAGDVTRGSAMFALAIEDMPIDQKKKQKALEALTPQQVDPAEHEQLKTQLSQLMELVNSGQVEKTRAETELTKSKKEVEDVKVLKTMEESRKLSKETDLATTENVSL